MEPKRFVKLAVYSVIAVLVILVFLKEISDVSYLRDENETVEKRVEELEAQNQAYRDEINAIKEDPEYLEKILREDLGMIKEREKIFRFEE